MRMRNRLYMTSALVIVPAAAAIAAAGPGLNAYVNSRQAAPRATALVDGLGSGVRISGDFAVAGACRQNDFNQFESGAAYVYQRTGDQWQPVQKLISSLPTTAERFGSALAIHKDVIAVAVPGHFFGVGSVHLFKRDSAQRSGEQWLSGQVIVPSDPKPGHQFGGGVGVVDALAFDGVFLVVGAPMAAAGEKNAAGKVYVFTDNAESREWSEQAILTAGEAAQEGAAFGHALALHGGTLIVGAPGEEEGRGAVYVFARTSQGEWTLRDRLSAQKPAAGDRFGSSIAYDGDRIAIGAAGAERAFVFAAGETHSASWRVIAQMPWNEAERHRNDGREMPEPEVVQAAQGRPPAGASAQEGLNDEPNE